MRRQARPRKRNLAASARAQGIPVSIVQERERQRAGRARRARGATPTTAQAAYNANLRRAQRWWSANPPAAMTQADVDAIMQQTERAAPRR